MREKILTIMEKNSRIDLADLAALLGERARSRWPMRSPIWRRKISSAATIR